MNIADLLDLPRLEDDLGRVETQLRQAVTSEDPFLTEVARHLVDAGGKRLRPALTVAAASLGSADGFGLGADGPGAPDGAAAFVMGGVSVELVHVGSLCHDDVIDEALTRRGVETVNARWGNLIAILAGDFLLARASEIAAGLGTEVAGLLAATIARLCQGQTLEIQAAYDVKRSESSYLAAIAGKTASLMSAACRIGALTSGQDRDRVDALTSFGHAFGMAFQICDDILDLVGTDESLGKPAGLDLVAGVYTLPVIMALADPDTGPALAPLLGGPIDPEARDQARQLVRASPALDQAVASARHWADQAGEAIGALPGPAAAHLSQLGFRLIDSLPA